MTAYVIALVEISDWEQYKEYVKRTPDVIAQYNGRFIARGGQLVTIEGPEETRRVVLLEFPTLEEAVACFRSAEYEAVKQFRLGAADMRLVAIEGYEAPR